MRKILSIAWKDTLVRFSSRTEWLFFVILPIIFTFFIGGGMSGSNSDERIPILLVNEDAGRISASLRAMLSNSASLNVTVLSRANAEAAFADKKASALLIIPAGTSQRLEAGEVTTVELRLASDDASAIAAEQAVRAALNASSQQLTIANTSAVEAEHIRPFTGQAERAAYFEESLAAANEALSAAPKRITITQPAAMPKTEFLMNAQASAGQLITWVFIPLLGISGLFAYERTSGTLRRMLSTPTRSTTFLLGTISGQFAIALVQMAILVGFGSLVMKVNYGSSPAGLAVLLITFGLAAVAFGVMLATFVKTESQASGLSIMLGMSMSLLGGCWYPIDLFPPVMRTAVKVLPTTWAMQGLTDLTMRAQTLAGILPEAGVLVGFAVVFFAIGASRLRFE